MKARGSYSLGLANWSRVPALSDSSTKTFAEDEFLVRTLGDRELALDVLRYSLDDIKERLSQIGAGLESGDAGAVRRHLHAIKGSSGTIAANALYERVKLVEEMVIESGNAPDVQEVARLGALFEEAVEAMRRGGWEM